MLIIDQLVAGYGKIGVLRGVSLKVGQGDIVTILGINGSGKSTILKCIIGLLPIMNGSISFRGERIHHLSANSIVRKRISLVPEGRQIFPNLTVHENLRIGGYIRRREKVNLAKDYERVFEIFPVLKNRLGQSGGTLSGGEQQMLAIGRALMARPELLLLDEPSLGLAPFVVREIFDVIKQINQEGVTILLVEQNVKRALSVAEYGFVLDTGKIVLEDQSINLVKNELVQKSFLG